MIQRLLKRLVLALRRGKIPYMIIGGQAVLFYGHPRLTQDVDVTVGVDIEGLGKVERVCKEIGLKPLVKETKMFVKQTRVLPAQDPESKLRVDFIFSNTLYEREAIRRAVRGRMGDFTVRMASLEDVIISKLVAAREIDLEDIRTLLAKHHSEINSRYIRKWLRKFVKSEVLSKNPLSEFNRLLKSA